MGSRVQALPPEKAIAGWAPDPLDPLDSFLLVTTVPLSSPCRPADTHMPLGFLFMSKHYGRESEAMQNPHSTLQVWAVPGRTAA